MIVRDIQIRVRYKETDAMGVVHHSNYVNFYEVARTEMLREFGTSYLELEQSGVMLPVRNLSMEFIAPAHYDDLLTVRIRLEELPTAKLTFHHEIFNEQGKLLNKGVVTLVFMESKTRRPCRVPQNFLNILVKNFSDK